MVIKKYWRNTTMVKATKFEICPLFEGSKIAPNGIIKVNGETIDYVVLDGKLVLSNPNLDKELVKQIAKDLEEQLTIETYRIKQVLN